YGTHPLTLPPTRPGTPHALACLAPPLPAQGEETEGSECRGRDSQRVLGDQVHEPRAGLPGLVTNARDDVVRLLRDGFLRLLLQMVAAELVAQRVDVAAHPLAGALDLPLDLLGRPLVRREVALHRLLPLVSAQGRCPL